jgi:hypothetical protein
MLLDGEWLSENGVWHLKLGAVFRAKVWREREPRQYGTRWITVLNSQQITISPDVDYAKGYMEWEIVKELTNLSTAYERTAEGH